MKEKETNLERYGLLDPSRKDRASLKKKKSSDDEDEILAKIPRKTPATKLDTDLFKKIMEKESNQV